MKDIKCMFRDTNDGRIFCTFIETQLKTDRCVIVFSPLFEERMWAQRVLLNFSRQLRDKGLSVLLFDYYGYGESDGDTEDFTISKCIKNVSDLIAMLENEFNYNEFIFLGLRGGCPIQLSCYLELSEKISSLIFWNPEMDLKKFIYKSIRSTIATQSWIFKKVVAKRDEIFSDLLEKGKCIRGGYLLNHIDGYRIGKDFYKEIENTNHITELQKIQCSSYVLEIIGHKKESLLENKRHTLNELYKDSGKITFDIIVNREFWENNPDYSQKAEDVYELSLDWLKKIGKIQ